MTRAWKVDNLDPNGSVETNARRILSVRVAEFYSHAPALNDPDAVEALHEMRIGAKRLRYTLELFENIFGVVGEKQTKRVKQLQEELGNIHDLDVRIDLIRNALSTIADNQLQELNHALASVDSKEHRSIIAAALRPPPDDPRRGLLALLGRQYAERRQHRAEVDRLWARFAAEGMRSDLVKLSSRASI
jgi:CHAD domain-containing protein